MKLFGKRFWASVLSLLMMLSVVPMQAFAEEMVYSEDASAASSQAVPSSSDTLATSNALSESAGRIDAGCIQLIGSNFFQ